MFHQKGHMKELEIAGGTLTIVLLCNPLELNPQEREFVFSIVDKIAEFENIAKDRARKTGAREA